jgi:hypothetical protein
VDDQPLAEQEQAGELARLEDRALAVLARTRRGRPRTPPTSRPARSPSAFARTNSSHGSSTSPAIRASSTASAPADDRIDQ